MLYKRHDEQDRRIKELALTSTGEETLESFREEWQKHLFDLLNDFTFNEEKAILKFLVKIEMKYKDAGNTPN